MSMCLLGKHILRASNRLTETADVQIVQVDDKTLKHQRFTVLSDIAWNTFIPAPQSDKWWSLAGSNR